MSRERCTSLRYGMCSEQYTGIWSVATATTATKSKTPRRVQRSANPSDGRCHHKGEDLSKVQFCTAHHRNLRSGAATRTITSTMALQERSVSVRFVQKHNTANISWLELRKSHEGTRPSKDVRRRAWHRKKKSFEKDNHSVIPSHHLPEAKHYPDWKTTRGDLIENRMWMAHPITKRMQRQLAVAKEPKMGNGWNLGTGAIQLPDLYLRNSSSHSYQDFTHCLPKIHPGKFQKLRKGGEEIDIGEEEMKSSAQLGWVINTMKTMSRKIDMKGDP